MNVHDWTRVTAGTFHDFHLSWISHIKESLNAGLLPAGYYAQAEQHAGHRIADVLTLHTTEHNRSPSRSREHKTASVALLEAPPRAALHLTAKRKKEPQGKPRTLAIRTTQGHRIVALIEIVSPSNKDRKQSVLDFITKILTALNSGIHVVVVDLLPSRRSESQGLHGAIWRTLTGDKPDLPKDRTLAVASYVARHPVEAYVNPLAVGEPMPDGALFLTPTQYVNLPLAKTYATTFRGIPAVWRELLENK